MNFKELIDKYLRGFALVLILAVARAPLSAQTPTFRAEISPDTVEIGELFNYVITVEQQQGELVAFPMYDVSQQTGSEPIEYVSEGVVDTLKLEGGKLKLRKEYLMQSFEDGDINLGVAQILYLNGSQVDTLSGRDSMMLHVCGFEIDSTTTSVIEIKPQRDLPFKFKEVRKNFAYTLLIALLLALVIYLIIRYLAGQGKGLGELFTPPPPPAPHIEAITALQALHKEKLWQNQKFKLYYSSMTDILRHYLSRRYKISAMEMTSDEIIAAIKAEKVGQKCNMNLLSLLRMADLVKFAKAEPTYEESEADYLKAYYFVEETKVLEDTNSGEDELSVKL